MEIIIKEQMIMSAYQMVKEKTQERIGQLRIHAEFFTCVKGLTRRFRDTGYRVAPPT
jgi:hypothetical protein